MNTFRAILVMVSEYTHAPGMRKFFLTLAGIEPVYYCTCFCFEDDVHLWKNKTH